MFVTLGYFHPSLIFADKAWSLPLEWILVRGSTLVVDFPPNIRLGRKQVTFANTLLYYAMTKNYDRKRFYSTEPGGVYTKLHITIILR